ncbi:M15 family metallopeptidase [Sphingobacterium multivorum]|uniref:M15 family metallopeptidase n=1 Tax=Sphingobacterium multivorum TaxID=28454 RepID=UPI0028AA6F6D|nr:M15 family metallopeptidase [Sphingobacterium multivorum]
MEDKRLQWADSITLNRIDLMHPALRDELRSQYLEINTRLPKGVRLRFTHTLRTFEEQNALYAQGRTTKGKIVTNAKGGSSWHNYGCAFDIVILYDKDGNGSFETASWDEDKYFMTVVNYFKSKGWFWGGDFRSFKDSPHFEKTFGLTISQGLTKYNAGETITENGIKYIKIGG